MLFLLVAVYFLILDIESDEEGLTVWFKIAIKFSDSHVLSILFVSIAYQWALYHNSVSTMY